MGGGVACTRGPGFFAGAAGEDGLIGGGGVAETGVGGLLAGMGVGAEGDGGLGGGIGGVNGGKGAGDAGGCPGRRKTVEHFGQRTAPLGGAGSGTCKMVEQAGHFT
jgi:hypothetical protein